MYLYSILLTKFESDRRPDRTSLQFISLQSILALLISSISLGNKKSINNLKSSITSIFVVLKSFIKNRVTAKSSDLMSVIVG